MGLWESRMAKWLSIFPVQSHSTIDLAYQFSDPFPCSLLPYGSLLFLRLMVPLAILGE
jgi:hypothetical protein